MKKIKRKPQGQTEIKPKRKERKTNEEDKKDNHKDRQK